MSTLVNFWIHDQTSPGFRVVLAEDPLTTSGPHLPTEGIYIQGEIAIEMPMAHMCS